VIATRGPRASARQRRGLTMGEMLVYMVLAGVVLSAIYSVMNHQGRGYARQLATIDVDESARAAGTVLAWDIRHSTMAGDSVVGFTTNQIKLRSVQGVGVVCAINQAQKKYGIWKTGGSIEAQASDSAMIYHVGNSSWVAAKILNVGTPANFGVTNCVWAGNRPPELAIELKEWGDTVGILVGSPVRAFRTVTYAAFQESGRWWLGRQAAGSASYEKLTGPLVGANGLSFAYLDSANAVATQAALLKTVRFSVITQSYRTYRNSNGASVYRTDTISTIVAVRR
jgi:hypothetical protein